VAACAQFEGGVVVISHDSQLLARVCDDAERSEARSPFVPSHRARFG
jgi:ATPase subunit of ABC transporter with duplicated ATPase domains